MCHPRKDLSFGSPVALQFIGGDDARHVGQALERLAEELLRGRLVAERKVNGLAVLSCHRYFHVLFPEPLMPCFHRVFTGRQASNAETAVLARYGDLIPAKAPSLRMWGAEDICYGGAYNWKAPSTTLATTGTAIINIFSVQGDPTSFEQNLIPGGGED